MPFKYQKREFPEDAFEGTALYYSRYRVPYPDVLFNDLINRIKPDQSMLLDLAAGPGRVTLSLAPFFNNVLANDIDKEMVSIGKAKAKEHKRENIKWITGKAEELNIQPKSVALITIGDAFHRLNQSLILDLSKKWLKPGGHIAILGMYSVWLGEERWHKLVKDYINNWTPNITVNIGLEFHDYGMMLEDKGLINLGRFSFKFTNHCNIESILGYLYSTSRCSKKILGDGAAEFESGLKAELSKLEETGRFSENITCGYTLGQKRS